MVMLNFKYIDTYVVLNNTIYGNFNKLHNKYKLKLICSAGVFLQCFFQAIHRERKISGIQYIRQSHLFLPQAFGTIEAGCGRQHYGLFPVGE